MSDHAPTQQAPPTTVAATPARQAQASEQPFEAMSAVSAISTVGRKLGNQGVQRLARNAAALPRVQRACACGNTAGASGTCDDCRKKEESALQRSAAGTPEANTAPSIVNDVINGGGSPLDPATNTFMSQRFGHDFSDVRVHTDSRAVESARAVSAHAYTVGRSIVFDGGKYSPDTNPGRALLAHELAHVVQQRGAAPAVQSKLTINEPGGADEVEADAMANAALSGADVPPATATPAARSAQRAIVQRATVQTDFQSPATAAQVCLVRLHGDESIALDAARSLRSRYCANLVWVDNPGRCVNVGPSCNVDPNRLFTARDKAFTATCPCPTTARTAGAMTTYDTFRADLIDKIGKCRGGSGGSLSGTLPVISLHNNTPGAPLSINSYTHASNTSRGESHATDTSVSGNPHIESPDPAIPRTDADNFFLVTRGTDFTTLSGRGYNVVQQATGPHSHPGSTAHADAYDDGSLSIALASERFINIEAKKVTGTGRAAQVALETTMGEEALTSYGISAGACPPATGTTPGSGGTPGGGATPGTASPPRSGAGTGNTPTTPKVAPKRASQQGLVPGAGRRVQRRASNSGNGNSAAPRRAITARHVAPGVQRQDAGGPAPAPATLTPMAREAQPAGSTRETAWTPTSTGCRAFVNQSDLDAAKARWAAVLTAMPVTEVIEWIIGVRRPPTAAWNESHTQMTCMLTALQAASRTSGSPITMTRQTDVTQHIVGSTRDGYRNYSDQEGIWNRKYNFTGAKFDRITTRAISACGPQIGAVGDQWDPGNPCHIVCWRNPSTSADTPKATAANERAATAASCALPTGSRNLTPDERQQEILEASSAPGISRHHWGTDYDLFSTEASDWRRRGTGFQDEFEWLMRNASMYGFIQSFTPSSVPTGGSGYMDERWHWSYYPIAQALLEYARGVQGSPVFDYLDTMTPAARDAEIDRIATMLATPGLLAPGGAGPIIFLAQRAMITAVLQQPTINRALAGRWGSSPQFSFIRSHWREYMFNVNETATF